MEDKINIVIADDNANIRSTLKDILTEKGYIVDTVDNGYELLSYLRNNSPQIVILDLVMPGKDGVEIFYSLKTIRPEIKIIIYTGFHNYAGSLYARNADKFILKNEPPEKLLNAIEELTYGLRRIEMETRNRIKDVLAKLLRVRPEELKDELTLENSISVDSTEMVEAAIALEKAFNVKLSPKEINKFSTLNDIEKIIQSKINSHL